MRLRREVRDGSIERSLSSACDPAVMTTRVDTEKLFDEIARYLAVVDAFRKVDCEPTWRQETVSVALPPSVLLRVEHLRSAH
jgi:hypothetical protein